jgi:hypothetical protein
MWNIEGKKAAFKAAVPGAPAKIYSEEGAQQRQIGGASHQ